MAHKNQIVISASAQITRAKERKAESATGVTDDQIEQSLASAAQNALLASASNALENPGDCIEITVIAKKGIDDK